MKRTTTYPGQRELFETAADGRSADQSAAIRELRARLRQQQPKGAVAPAGHEVPRLSAMARSEIYK